MNDVVNVNDVVDAQEHETNPTNVTYVPRDKVEFGHAVNDLAKGVAVEDIPRLFNLIKQVVDNFRAKDDETMKNMSDNASSNHLDLENIVRLNIRNILNEMKNDEGDDGNDDDRNDNDVEDKKELLRDNDEYGDDYTYKEIAKEFGLTLAGARQFANRVLDKVITLAKKIDPDDLDEFTYKGVTDYIGLLQSLGNITPEEIQMLKDNPEIVRELDGFREYMQPHVRQLIKSLKKEL